MSKDDNKSFFQTLPGILTGLASLIAAATGLFIALNNSGTKPPQKQTTVIDSVDVPGPEEEHQRNVEKLKKEKEIATIRLQQERERLEAQKELEKIRLETENQKALATEKRALSERQQQTPNIEGPWMLTNLMGTYTFVFEQNGSTILVEEYDPMGNVVGNGRGTIQNRLVNFDVTETMLFNLVQSRVSLELSQDGQRLTGQIFSQGASIAATFFKQ